MYNVKSMQHKLKIILSVSLPADIPLLDSWQVLTVGPSHTDTYHFFLYIWAFFTYVFSVPKSKPKNHKNPSFPTTTNMWFLNYCEVGSSCPVSAIEKRAFHYGKPVAFPSFVSARGNSSLGVRFHIAGASEHVISVRTVKSLGTSDLGLLQHFDIFWDFIGKIMDPLLGDTPGSSAGSNVKSGILMISV